MTLRLVCAFLAFILLHGAASASPINYDRIDERLSELVLQDDMIGLAVAIIDDGEIQFAKGYGETRRSGELITEATVFRWASLSKGVASTAAMQLVDAGILSLSDPVSGFQTSLRLPGGGERKATIENLLSHMLGIVPNAYDTRLEDGNDPADIRPMLGMLKATCQVGTCYTYQNVAFDAVSEIIETATGNAYADMVRENLFEPLKMQTASFGSDDLKAASSWAEPHRKRARDPKPMRKTVKEPYYRVPAAGGVNGSILDLAKFARAQMGLMPEVVSSSQLIELHTPRVYTRSEQSSMSRRYGGHLRDARYALGWRVYKYGKPGYRVIGHRGAVEGYRSLILFDPERKAGVVALWNSSSRKPNGIQFEVMDMVYGMEPKDWLQLDTAATN